MFWSGSLLEWTLIWIPSNLSPLSLFINKVNCDVYCTLFILLKVYFIRTIIFINNLISDFPWVFELLLKVFVLVRTFSFILLKYRGRRIELLLSFWLFLFFLSLAFFFCCSFLWLLIFFSFGLFLLLFFLFFILLYFFLVRLLFLLLSLFNYFIRSYYFYSERIRTTISIFTMHISCLNYKNSIHSYSIIP